jgi:hypothetical protein
MKIIFIVNFHTNWVSITALVGLREKILFLL